jgi:hypothetical protein
VQKLKWSISDIITATGESRSNVNAAIKCGHIPTFIVGRRRFARPEAVREWVDYLQRESDQGRAVKYQSRDVNARPKSARRQASQ